MASETTWGKDTVSLGVADPAAREAGGVDSGEAPELANAAEGDARWGTETVVLGNGQASRTNGSASSGHRRPPWSRAVVATVAGVVIGVLAIGVMSVIGGGEDRRAQPVAPPPLTRGTADRKNARPKTRIREERRRHAERKAKAAHIARERRLRERRHRQPKAARVKPRAPSEPTQVPEPAAEVEPEYVPEYAPQPEPAPEAPPPPSPAPTSPGVEFGM